MIQDKWVDNRKLSEQFIDSLKIQEKSDKYNGDINFKARQNLSDKILENSKLDDRLGIYCGNINFQPENKEGHLVVEYIWNNPKTQKYEYGWRIIFKNKKGKSLWEDIGEIDPEYIEGKSLSQITGNINFNVKKQIEEDTKLTISRDEKAIVDAIEIYQNIYSLEEDDETMKKITKKIGKDKKTVLEGLENEYKIHLYNLKRLGGDISEYPKRLEDLTK
jgi:hypothetical protein